jgi:hypothetical protein
MFNGTLLDNEIASRGWHRAILVEQRISTTFNQTTHRRNSTALADTLCKYPDSPNLT